MITAGFLPNHTDWHRGRSIWKTLEALLLPEELEAHSTEASSTQFQEEVKAGWGVEVVKHRSILIRDSQPLLCLCRMPPRHRTASAKQPPISVDLPESVWAQIASNLPIRDCGRASGLNCTTFRLQLRTLKTESSLSESGEPICCNFGCDWVYC
jgi:hypothetical protein